MARALVSFFLIFTFLKSCELLVVHEHDGEMVLEQVVALGRHNIRAPLTLNLEKFTPRKWPVWAEKAAFLTPKGFLLETYLGQVVLDWLKTENLLTEDCPTEYDVFIYSNTLQRTKETAKAFATIFKQCNVPVHNAGIEGMDPIFNPVIHNSSDAFIEKASAEMVKRLKELNLTDAYAVLNDILDVKNSEYCIKEHVFCDLTEIKDDPILKVGEEPNVSGPLNIGHEVVDTFLMSYYNGPFTKTAWGLLTEEKLDLLMKISRENQYMRFKIPLIAKDVSKPLIDNIGEMLQGGVKFTLLVGHDSNLNSVMTALGFKNYVLERQRESIPIGSMLLIQKWISKRDGKHYLKLNLVYATTEQLKTGDDFSNEGPVWKLLELNRCPIDNAGFCSWECFEDVLKEFHKGNFVASRESDGDTVPL